MSTNVIKAIEPLNIRRPNNFREYEKDGSIITSIMSNFDDKIQEDVAEAIKNKPLWAYYTAWDFIGEVWWQANQWHCEIWKCNCYIKTISKDTLQEIIDDACSKFGYD